MIMSDNFLTVNIGPHPDITQKYLTLKIISTAPITNNITPFSKRKSKYTVASIVEQGNQVHKNTVDYSLVKDSHITNSSKSNIPLICKVCHYGINGEWYPSIYHHLKGSKCPSCVGVAPWTYERFIIRSKQINGTKYNYDKVTPKHICNKYSKVPLICNNCNYGINGEWTPTIHDHINGNCGCPRCANNIWTYDKFIIKAIEIHGNSVNYDHVIPELIVNAYSKLFIICNLCDYGMNGEWSPTITEHINKKSSCPSCNGTARWTYDRFINKIISVNNGRYNYKLVNPNQIINANSRIPIICNNCDYGSNGEWMSTIRNHIHNHLKVDYCCPQCMNIIPWSLERFLTEAQNIHNSQYDYSLITKDNIKGRNSKIPILCTTCNRISYPSINSHIHSKNGCKYCRFSKGEIGVTTILEKHNIQFRIQYSIPDLPDRYYDFMVILNNMNILIEFDGRQHFEYVDFFNKGDYNYFLMRQEVDRIKTSHALDSGYYFIRIDYNEINNIEKHILSAFDSFIAGSKLYLSNAYMYKYLNLD